MKKFLAIMVLGLFVCSNAYAITLSKCYLLHYKWADEKPLSDDEKALSKTEFDEAKLDDYYFRVDFENNIVTQVYILSDEEIKKQKADPTLHQKHMLLA